MSVSRDESSGSGEMERLTNLLDSLVGLLSGQGDLFRTLMEKQDRENALLVNRTKLFSQIISAQLGQSVQLDRVIEFLEGESHGIKQGKQ
jgi:hypothetical protein